MAMLASLARALRLTADDAHTIAMAMQEVADRLRDTAPAAVTRPDGTTADPAVPVPSLPCCGTSGVT